MELKLYVYKDKLFKETFEWPNGRRVDITFLGLTNTFLRTFLGVLFEQVIDLLKARAHQLYNKLDLYQVDKIFIEYSNTLLAKYLEAHLMQLALEKWLSPTRLKWEPKKTPSQKYTDFWDKFPWYEKERILQKAVERIDKFSFPAQIYVLTEKVCLGRNKQFVTLFSFRNIKKKTKTNRKNRTFPEECYISKNGFLPLVWAEIFYAVKNDIFARPCEICACWFPIENGHYNQKYCSPQCRSKSKRLKMNRKRAAR